MTTQKPKRYGHLVIIIRHCGVKLTKALFEKCVSDIRKKGSKHPCGVDDFLKKNKKALLEYQSIKNREYLFFPGPDKKANVNEWDLSIYCFLLLNFCNLRKEISQDIKSLKDLRNNVLHFGGTTDVPEDQYKTYIDRLKGISNRCTDEFSDLELKSELENLIESNENIQDNDVEEGETDLRHWSFQEETLRVKISIEQKDVDEVKTELIDYHLKLEENDRSTNIEISLTVGISWSAKSNENKDLEQAKQDISSGAPVPTQPSARRTFRIAIAKMADDVRAIGNTSVENISPGSIMFKFTCSSLTSLIYLLEYFSGPIIQRRLLDLTKAIEEMTDDLVTLNVFVAKQAFEETVETLHDVLKQGGKYRALAYKGQKLSAKIFNDPLYGQIELHPLLLRIIDTPQFQRLRYIKQLETVYLVYPGASHNRFEHSIGVCHLAGRLLRVLKERQPELDITTKDILCVEIAALCHDLGQGPFSHMFEKKFIPEFHDEWKHETASVKLFEAMLHENDGKLYKQFSQMISGFEDTDIIFIKELIGVHQNISGENWPYKGRNKLKSFLYEVVSNSVTGIDVDRWDYIARDSYMLGMETAFDYNRCIHHARVLLTPEGRRQICYRDKAAQDLYDMFYARITLYRRAYQHKTHNIIGLMLRKALRDANDHISFVGENGAKVRMSETIFDMKAYTHLTDDIIQKIQRSSKEGLAKSKATLERIVRRDFYKCICQTQVDVTKKGWLEQIFVQDNLYNKINKKRKVVTDLSEILEIDVVDIDYGSKDKDPVANVWFYKKGEEDLPIRVDRSQVSFVLPDTFAEQYVRVYCSETDTELCRVIEGSFQEWCQENNIPKPKGSSK